MSSALRLGDRVPNWMTHERAVVRARSLGYGLGEHAPGRRGSGPEPWLRPTTCCSRTGCASRVLRREHPGRRVGITIRSLSRRTRSRDADEDIDAGDGSAGRLVATAGSSTRFSAADIPRVLLEPPTSTILPRMRRRRSAQSIAAPLDFLGVNYYSRARCARRAGSVASRSRSTWPRCRAHRDGVGGVSGMA